MAGNLLQSELTAKIINGYYKVYNTLGYGFLEKVYEKALFIELTNRGLCCSRQIPIDVFYDREKVGYYFADLIVEDSVIIEIKAAESLCDEHEAQLVNYLKATTIEVGLLLNFGKKPQFKRKVFSSQYKNLN
jgi:GxxExxY protein